MAGVTGLEPAASGVTGQRSNQLSYTPLPRLKSFLRDAEIYDCPSIMSSSNAHELCFYRLLTEKLFRTRLPNDLTRRNTAWQKKIGAHH